MPGLHVSLVVVRADLPPFVGLPLAFAVFLGLSAIVVAAGGLPAPVTVLAFAVGSAYLSIRVAGPSGALVAVLGWLFGSAFVTRPYGVVSGRYAAASALFVAAPSLVCWYAANHLRLGAGTDLAGGQRSNRPLETPGSFAILDRVTGAPSPRRRFAVPVRLGWKRSGYGFLAAAVSLPLLTLILTATARDALADVVLAYLLGVLLVTLIGGVWPGLTAAVVASLLINWYFSPPIHTWTIDAPRNMVVVLLFVAATVTVSALVHTAARRAALARLRQSEADALLRLADRLLGGEDDPQAVVDQLVVELGVPAVLEERCGDRWVAVTRAPFADENDDVLVFAGPTLRLRVGKAPHPERLLRAYAAQAAAALERSRLRIQAAQTEALAAANRMRTALLAAVSHDLRTPLASIKASVSTLRQTDVRWSEADIADLLAEIDDATDRLNALIANLLDMSRIQTGAVQPSMRTIALEEVLPHAFSGLEGVEKIILDLPEDLPLIRTDPGLLERALANVVSNALRYSPADRPPEVVAREGEGRICIDIIDHGCGVPRDKYDEIFQPFQQLGDRGGGGVGLGLAVARGFVEILGGELRPSATPGGGLTMRVELPAATDVPSDVRPHRP